MSGSDLTNELMAAGLAWLPASLLGDTIGTVISVLDYGALGDGVHDDTVAVQKAATAAAGGALFFPAGDYLLSTPIVLQSGTTAYGCGAGSKLVASANFIPMTGPASAYMFFINQNWKVTSLTDSNITIQNMAFTYVNLQVSGGSGGNHAIRMYFVDSVKVQNCWFYYGNDAVTILGCNDVQIIGNSAFFNTDCPWDCFYGATNVRIIGNYMETAHNCILACFNASAGVNGPTTGLTSDGCVIADNQFIYSGSATGAILISPLGSGNVVKNVIITNNRLVGNCEIAAGQGNMQNIIIANNLATGNTSTNSVIGLFTDGVDNPNNITICGNSIIDPLTTHAAGLGVIRVTQASDFSIFGNTVTGSGFNTACYTVGSTGIVGPNNFSVGTEGTVNTGGSTWSSLSGNLRIGNGFGLDFVDANGGIPQFIMQADNNLILYGTDASGVARVIMSILMHSSASRLVIAADTQLSQAATTNILVTGGTTGIAPLIQANSVTDTNVDLRFLGKGTGGVRVGASTTASPPTTVTLPSGQATVYVSGTAATLYCNAGGTLRSVALV